MKLEAYRMPKMFYYFIGKLAIGAPAWTRIRYASACAWIWLWWARPLQLRRTLGAPGPSPFARATASSAHKASLGIGDPIVAAAEDGVVLELLDAFAAYVTRRAGHDLDGDVR